jgi:hypothetical protein
VGGVPFHLVGSKYLVQVLPPVEVIKFMEQDGGDCVEEVLAQGSVPVLRKTSHLGESDDPTGVTSLMARQFTDPSRGNPMGCFVAEVRRLEFRSTPSPLTELGAPSGPHGIDDYDSMPSIPRLGYRVPVSMPSYPCGESVASRTTVPSMGEHVHSSDEYYGYTGDERRRPN